MNASKSPATKNRRPVDPQNNLQRDLAVFNEVVTKYCQQLAAGKEVQLTFIVAQKPCPPAESYARAPGYVPESQPKIAAMMITGRGLAVPFTM